MSGLREQQKEMRKQAISQAAVALFASQGYQDTTIEQIAREAGVSVPTVFKYFGSKQEIVLEMLNQEDPSSLSETCERMLDFADPLDALCHLEQMLIDHALKELPASIWREVLPAILSGGSNTFSERYREMNERLLAEISGLLRKLQAAGKLRADLDVELAAYLLNDYSHLQLLRLTSQETMDMEAHRYHVRRTSGLVLRGMLA
ncbi:helix-turn-helix domain-containing protein [Pseudomonas sp. App30]|uniref:TetR/AcrR family transcriptional regulator n=1 Tax=Pseudomonas sp. App30 TaxID=3068990 RepID=UPI003A8019ED